MVELIMKVAEKTYPRGTKIPLPIGYERYIINKLFEVVLIGQERAGRLKGPYIYDIIDEGEPSQGQVKIHPDRDGITIGDELQEGDVLFLSATFVEKR